MLDEEAVAFKKTVFDWEVQLLKVLAFKKTVFDSEVQLLQ